MAGKIAIIDDNKDQRETLQKALKILLSANGSDLDVITVFPFENLELYSKWILDEEICVLIFDEKMHDGREDGQGPVHYKGSDLVDTIRQVFKDIPIFTVTAYANDEELRAKFGHFEQIINRKDFIWFGDRYVNIIIRASQRYLDQNQKEMAEYNSLTKLAALGDIDQKDSERLEALQIKLSLPVINTLKDRGEWIRKYESQIDALNQLLQTVQAKVKKL
ncbi:hypothetical protein [Larkinella soli]|uniref:hypothetical protein n=1 Tax=Larkinella soli TaxID=1770527 RepID=UPI000FFB2DAE|nr:hypothetical protein [Larkinella soli]